MTRETLALFTRRVKWTDKKIPERWELSGILKFFIYSANFHSFTRDENSKSAIRRWREKRDFWPRIYKRNQRNSSEAVGQKRNIWFIFLIFEMCFLEYLVPHSPHHVSWSFTSTKRRVRKKEAADMLFFTWINKRPSGLPMGGNLKKLSSGYFYLKMANECHSKRSISFNSSAPWSRLSYGTFNIEFLQTNPKTLTGYCMDIRPENSHPVWEIDFLLKLPQYLQRMVKSIYFKPHVY